MKSSDEVSRGRDLIAALAVVSSDMKDAETGQRGYIIAGDERYLEPDRTARNSINGDVAGLEICWQIRPMSSNRFTRSKPRSPRSWSSSTAPWSCDKIEDLRRLYASPALRAAHLGKILVVEDDAVSADLIQSHLTSSGYEVMVCKDSQFAVAMAAELQPRAITLDILMTPVTGWDLLVKLRNDARTSEIPIRAAAFDRF